MQEIENWLRTNFTGNFSDQFVIDSFFMKRKHFSHEEEVRIIITTPTIQDEKIPPHKVKGVTIKIDPNQIIQQIAFDPRLPLTRCKLFMQMLLRYGYADIKYARSSYYTLKPLDIEL